jgi:hypothetical protein
VFMIAACETGTVPQPVSSTETRGTLSLTADPAQLSAAQPLSIIRATVTDALGQPVAGVRVLFGIYNNSGQESLGSDSLRVNVVTDSDGRVADLLSTRSNGSNRYQVTVRAQVTIPARGTLVPQTTLTQDLQVAVN